MVQPVRPVLLVRRALKVLPVPKVRKAPLVLLVPKVSRVLKARKVLRV